MQFQQLVLVLGKYGKISDVQATGSTVTTVLKKAVPAVKKSCLLWAKANEVKWVLSDCWEGHFNIYFMDLAENGKISLKGILLFLL